MNTDLSELFALDKILINSSQSVMQIFLSLLITFLIAMFIYWVYKKTYNGVLYSKNFNITLVMTSLIVNALMIGISGNLVLSLGLVGALSIVRFRTAIKDPKDTGFVFWAISIGVINGVGFYELSLMATLFIALVLFVLSRQMSFSPNYMLVVKYSGNHYAAIQKVLESEFKNYFIRTDTQKKDHTEKVIEVQMKKDNHEQSLQKIRDIEGVQSCILISSNGEFSE
jgi:uncharacterized membrane protein YhiD involved in acid resistance